MNPETCAKLAAELDTDDAPGDHAALLDGGTGDIGEGLMEYGLSAAAEAISAAMDHAHMPGAEKAAKRAIADSLAAVCRMSRGLAVLRVNDAARLLEYVGIVGADAETAIRAVLIGGRDNGR